MKKLHFIIFCITANVVNAQNNPSVQQIENLRAFSKLYGYVRYFHPSDEASQIDWDKFAIYGSKQVENAANSEELIKVLNKLFIPIAPSIKLFKSNEKLAFDINSITPPNIKEYKEIYWQHLGLCISKENIYRSIRVNRRSLFTVKTSGFNSVCKQLNLSSYKNKEFIFKAYARVVGGETNGYLWVREDLEKGGAGFFYNMNDRPISKGKWEEYVIKGKVGMDGKLINFGAYVMGEGSMFIDNMSLSFKNDNEEWVEVYKNDFETDGIKKQPSDLIHGIGKGNNGLAGVLSVVNQEPQGGKNCLLLAQEELHNDGNSKLNKPIFDFKPKPTEYITKSINRELSCIIPISLYGTDENTFPKGDGEQLRSVVEDLQKLNTASAGDLYVRIGDVIIAYNIMQHFYPYFDVVNTDWNEAFSIALKECYGSQGPLDFLAVIQKFTAQLKDGHVRVSYFNDSRRFVPEIETELIEGKLVVTELYAEKLNIPIGSVIDKVDNVSASDYVKDKSQYISAPTQGWLNYRLSSELFVGNLGDSLILNYTRPDGKSDRISLFKNRKLYSETGKPTTIKKLTTDIYYVNIDKASMKIINDSMDKLRSAKAIICDLRGYPNNNHDFIRHLLKEKDTTTAWMRIPEIIYPDYQVSGFANEGWGLKPEKPHLSAKIVFIIDGSAISYAESYMGFIEGYKLATIVGQPTAGSNGNVNSFKLPGGYYVSFTGMKVVRHNGTQQHAIGILPNVYVNKTIKGVIEGRDEFLEKALEIAGKN